MKNLLSVIAFVAVGVVLASFQDKPKVDLKASMAKGKDTYVVYCMSCHMENGEGLEDVYPPLAKSDYLLADKKRMIQQILFGVSGPMKVNGKTYNAEMTGFDLTDEEAANLSNYILNSWGNKGQVVSPEEVKSSRK